VIDGALTDPDELVALGAFAGAQVLVVIFSVIKANAYHERAYLLHAAATMVAVLAVQTLAGTQPLFPQAVLLIVMAAASLQLRDLMSHAGALREARRWMVGLAILLVPMAFASAVSLWVLVAGVVAWSAMVGVVLRRTWRQSQPWIWWLVPGLGALGAAGAALSWLALGGFGGAALPVAGLLTLWTAAVYLATSWRGRIFGETKARIDARNTIDPLTGLSTPLVLAERVNAARNMMQRYGHPSVLLLIHLENLGRISAEFGPEAAEAAVLAAANRVRQALRDGDVAARMTHSRIAVLAEGVSPAEGAANVASRILVAGLKEPLPALPTEFLHFRVVLAAVPVEEMPVKALLQRLSGRLDQALHAPTERRIVTLTNEEVVS
jgi:diguanylate cyclase (GGDEF)-like protein